MMRSMFSGVSGLRVHQTRMDVIGNNIANVNTVGYKSTSAQFAESFSQVMRGAGSPQGGLGGTNPQQIGLGVQVAALDVNHNKGSAQRTDKPLDLMIDGNGFFCVTNDPNYENKYYTRAGNFTTDVFGNVVTPSGFKLLGFDGKPIVVDKTKTRTGSATSNVEIVGNMNELAKLSEEDVTDKIAFETSMKVFDSLGTAHTININFGQRLEYATPNPNPTERGFLRAIQFQNDNIISPEAVAAADAAAAATADANAGIFTDKVKIDGKEQDTKVLGKLDRANLTTDEHAPANVYYAKFDEFGTFQGIVKSDGGNIAINIDETKGKVGLVTAIPTYVTDYKLSMQPDGAEPIEIKLFTEANTTTGDPAVNAFSKLTHYSAESSSLGKRLNGNASGFLDNFNVSATGEIIGIFTNGERESLGQIALATFDNNVGLQKIGNNMFVDTVNSGAPKIGKPGSGSYGKIAPGAIEMSNVDLSGEFTDMITTQRGFQANSRVVTTSDEMLQELVNLKR